MIISESQGAVAAYHSVLFSIPSLIGGRQVPGHGNEAGRISWREGVAGAGSGLSVAFRSVSERRLVECYTTMR